MPSGAITLASYRGGDEAAPWIAPVCVSASLALGAWLALALMQNHAAPLRYDVRALPPRACCACVRAARR
jgi:hypothetical protein